MPIIKVDFDSHSQLQEIADALGRSKKVVVLTGAGISTTCGIPDFRSKDGLYSLIQNQYEAALKNPPWENLNVYDINNRPKKKRKPWYYEVVTPDGSVVDVIDDDLSKQQTQTSKLCCTTSSESVDTLKQKITSVSLPTSPTHKVKCGGIQKDDSLQLQGQLDGNTSCQDQVKSSNYFSKTEESQSVSNSIEATEGGSLSHPSSMITNTERLKERLLEDHPNPAFHLKNSNEAIDLFPPVEDTHSKKRESEDLTGCFEFKNPSSSSIQLTKRVIPNLKGRDLFDAMIWTDPVKTSIFYMFMTSFRKKAQLVKSTSETHRFFKVLRDSGRLVRTYTQNIDCLEEKEGLSTDLTLGPGNRARFHPRNHKLTLNKTKLDLDKFRGVEAVLLHGSLGSLRCEVCLQLCDWDKDDRIALTSRGTAPDCPHCTAYNTKRRVRGGRALTVGRLRPDIVLYGEEHPNSSLISPLITHDLKLGPDMLLVMGTSLKIHGLKIMIKEFAKVVHSRGGKVVFVNQTRPPESIWSDVIDYWVSWDCDKWVLDLKERIKELWLPQDSSGGSFSKRKLGAYSNSQEVKRVRLRASIEDKSSAAYFVSKIMKSLAQEDPDSLHEEKKHNFKRRSFKSYTKKSTTRMKKITDKLLPNSLKNCFSANSPSRSFMDVEAPSSNFDKQKNDSNAVTSFFSKNWHKCWAELVKEENHFNSSVN